MVDQLSNIPEPPEEFVKAVGGGDFYATGQKFFRIFVNHGGLLPNHHVLDIGSGCGRMAIPLTTYLDDQSEYHGLDIVKPMVNWCVENISPRYPNFKFHHAQLKNSVYSAWGDSASNYKFPFPDKKFDFVFLTSVFTHFNLKDTENYLGEIKRVLKTDGTVLMTFYLMTEEYRVNRRNNRAFVSFDHGKYPFWFNDPKAPDVSAYDEAFILGRIRKKGLSIDALNYGDWNNHKGWCWQDVVVASRKD